MAYVLGYLYADGSLENSPIIRGKYVRVTSTDKITISKFKSWLGSGHKIVKINPPSHNRKPLYRLRIGSHKMYNDLINLGLYPHKSLTIKLISLPNKFLSDFVRGYFDGDGCVYVEKNKDKTRIKRLSIIFSSGSKIFLEQLRNMLSKKINLSMHPVHKGNRSFQLRYSTKDSLELFKLMYHQCPIDICLKRKSDIFLSYFKSRSRKLPDNIILR